MNNPEEPIFVFEGKIYRDKESINFHFRGSFDEGRTALRQAIQMLQRRLDDQEKCPFHTPEN